MPKLKKARNLSLVEDVVRQIEGAIFDGEYVPGDKLPSTRALMEIFGASLGTIRESLAIIENKGLLEVKKGSKGGFFIRDLSTDPMTDSIELLMRLKSLSPRELYEFRTTVEAGVIRLVVLRASEADLERFHAYLDKFALCQNTGQAGFWRLCEVEQELRKDFLRTIDNRTYEAVLTPIISNLIEYARHKIKFGDKETQLAYEYWKKIIPAIAQRDEEKAASLVKQLLFAFMKIMA